MSGTLVKGAASFFFKSEIKDDVEASKAVQGMLAAFGPYVERANRSRVQDPVEVRKELVIRIIEQYISFSTVFYKKNVSKDEVVQFKILFYFAIGLSEEGRKFLSKSKLTKGEISFGMRCLARLDKSRQCLEAFIGEIKIEGDTPLHEAAAKGDLESIKRLLKESDGDKSALLVKNAEGLTALDYARLRRQTSAVELLSGVFKKEESVRPSALNVATQELGEFFAKNYKAFLKLSRFVDDKHLRVNLRTLRLCDMRLIHVAVFCGTVKDLKALLKKGADLNLTCLRKRTQPWLKKKTLDVYGVLHLALLSFFLSKEDGIKRASYIIRFLLNKGRGFLSKPSSEGLKKEEQYTFVFKSALTVVEEFLFYKSTRSKLNKLKMLVWYIRIEQKMEDLCRREVKAIDDLISRCGEDGLMYEGRNPKQCEIL